MGEVEFVGQRPTEEIIEAVLAKLHPVVRPLYEFILEIGCRREEALGLKHWQVDIPHRVVTFAKTKNARGRQVPLTERAVRAIQTIPRTTTDYVFYHPVSLTRWSECRKPWEQARKEAGHPWLRVHDLRHAFAIRLAEAGCPMHFISEVLAHHSVDFTRKQHAKFSPESATKAVLRVLEGGRYKEPAQETAPVLLMAAGA